MKKWNKKIKEGEIVIASSDKSNRFVVLKKSQYIQSGLKHTELDKIIQDEEIVKFQTVINAHTAWLTDIFKMGSVWNHEDRMHKNVSEKGEQTCPMV